MNFIGKVIGEVIIVTASGTIVVATTAVFVPQPQPQPEPPPQPQLKPQPPPQLPLQQSQLQPEPQLRHRRFVRNSNGSISVEPGYPVKFSSN